MAFQKISVMGLGYIGLPTAAVFASRKIKVIGVDVNQHAVDTINQGKIHIVEPDLDIIVRATVNGGYLKATTTPEEADAFLIAVPTPFKDDHVPDLKYIEAASISIAAVLKKGDLVILESTSPVGTTEKMAAWMAQERPDLSFPQDAGENADINVAHCPERVLPGRIMRELVQNDRIIGGMTRKCAERASELYKVFVQGECIITESKTAELSKLTENAFRDVNIAFANELSIICDKLGINVWELIRLANRHPRVNILNPGPGVGGHCIAVDPWFIVDSCPEEARLIRTSREVNDGKPHYILDKIRKVADEFKRPSIACLGVAFKADIDDLRESPAVEIVKQLKDESLGQLLIVEPNVKELPEELQGENTHFVSLEEAISKSNILVILVDHKEFKNISKTSLQQKFVIDTRGLIDG